MNEMLIEFAEWAVIALVAAAFIGHMLPGLFWVILASLAICVGPSMQLYYKIKGSEATSTAYLGVFQIGLVTVFGAEVGLWLGYMFT